MAKYGPRLSWASSNGPDPELSLTDEDWGEIEGAYGRALSQEVRCGLSNIGQRYFFGVRPERESGLESEVRAHASNLAKSLEGFVKWAHGVRPPSQAERLSDTYCEFEHRLETWLKSGSIRIGRRNLELDESIPDYIEDWLENNPLELALDFRVIVEMAIRIQSGLAVIEASPFAGLAEGNARGFVPGQSWKTFLLAAYDFACSSGLPRALYVDGGTKAAAFPKMLFALHSKFPKEFKHSVNSESALAEQLKRQLQKRCK